MDNKLAKIETNVQKIEPTLEELLMPLVPYASMIWNDARVITFKLPDILNYAGLDFELMKKYFTHFRAEQGWECIVSLTCKEEYFQTISEFIREQTLAAFKTQKNETGTI